MPPPFALGDSGNFIAKSKAGNICLKRAKLNNLDKKINNINI
jgi:hypothetical protein